MADVIALIPARAGSKGVVDKNIKLLAGYPLISYSIAAAKLVDSIERVIVSTDSNQYANIALEYGAEIPFLRPEEISCDSSSDYDFIIHALEWIRDNENFLPKYLVHLRPTTPLRDPVYIEKAIKLISHDTHATSLRSVHEMSETAYKAVEIDTEYLKCVCTGSFDLDSTNQPRQEFPKTYVTNGYVDIYKTSYIMENRKILGDKVIAYLTRPTFEVDTIEDFDYLEYQVEKEPNFLKGLFTKE